MTRINTEAIQLQETGKINIPQCMDLLQLQGRRSQKKTSSKNFFQINNYAFQSADMIDN